MQIIIKRLSLGFEILGSLYLIRPIAMQIVVSHYAFYYCDRESLIGRFKLCCQGSTSLINLIKLEFSFQSDTEEKERKENVRRNSVKMQALYDYKARDVDEIDLTSGEEFERVEDEDERGILLILLVGLENFSSSLESRFTDAHNLSCDRHLTDTFRLVTRTVKQRKRGIVPSKIRRRCLKIKLLHIICYRTPNVTWHCI